MSKYQITSIIYIHTGMNEWMKFDTWEFPHKTQHVHIARCTHAYITQLYIMSIQPVNLINSTPVLERKEKKKKREREGVCMCCHRRENPGSHRNWSMTEMWVMWMCRWGSLWPSTVLGWECVHTQPCRVNSWVSSNLRGSSPLWKRSVMSLLQALSCCSRFQNSTQFLCFNGGGGKIKLFFFI